ncbi:MAG: MBL fold metallo-hydrolase, partial [Rubrivivax sp.]
VPPEQHAEADRGEAIELMWITPTAALDPARGLVLLPVTRRTLQDLQRHADAATAHAAAGQLRVVPLTMPRRARGGGGDKSPRIVLPDEPAYAELARLDPDGMQPASCEIVPGVAVWLSPRIVRVTAPNPGVMTGPGTNSYLVGDPDPAQGGWTLIDPGPDDAEHRAALLAAAGARAVVQILTTHTHKDHSPGAAALQAATGARVLGRRAPPHPGQDHGFAPDHEPADGDRLVLGPATTLRAIHTPGHASNHLCWLLEQERLLFTGDQVMQGSTVVINPPDGDMAAYLRALESLLDEDLEWFAPGHGFLIATPHAVLRALIAHRLRREAKVLAALASHGPGDLAALVRVVYDEVPAALHPVAQRSLLAHLLKLRHDGRAVERDEGVWAAA